MKKRFTILITAAFMLLTMMASTGTMWGQSDYSTTYTSNVTLPTSGTQASSCMVVIGGTNYSGTKLGKSGAGGSASITAPAGTKHIHLHVAAWNGKSTGFTYKIGSGTAQSISGITSNSGIANNSPFTFSGDASSSNYYKVITLSSALTEATSITFASTSERVVFWGVNTEEAGSNPIISADDVEIAYNTTSGSIEYSIENGDGNVSASITTGDWLTLGTITASEVPFTCSANEAAAARTATVTLSFTGASNKVVTITQAGNPNAPGTENNPYTVAQARAAIDAGTGVTGVYATGIVSEIVTAYGTGGYNNVTFNMVDEAGDEVFLQAYRCVGDDAPNVLVGDIAVVTGNLTKYGQTYEFASGCSVVSLEHPSTPYITANDVEITYNATAGSIAYTVENPVQGGQLTAATTSTWLTLSNTFTSPIAFTCDANEAAASRTATVTLTYTYGAKTIVNKDITVTQAGSPEVYNNISDITAVGTTYSVKGTVVAINSRGFVMGDGTGYVYYYKNGAVSQSVGDMVTVAGTTGTYGQIIQFTNTATVGEATTSSYNNTPAAEVITAVPDYSTGYHLSTYLEFEGALAKSSGNYLITVGESQIQISYPTTDQGTALTALVDKTVHVKGYFSGINSSSKFTVMLESAEEVVIPSITVNPTSVEAPADETEGTITVTLTAIANNDIEVQWFESDGTTAANYNHDWILTDVNTDKNIDYVIGANTGAARTAYFKVYGMDGEANDVYSDLVTISQAAYVAPTPSIAVTPTLVEATADETQGTITVTLTAIANNEIEVQWFESDGTTAATYNHDWIEATVDPNNDIDYIIEENTGDARSAYFKVYGLDGETNDVYSELITINQAAYVVDYATLPFEWDDTSTPTGITNYGVGTYSSSPYLKFDNTGDYIILKINERPGSLSFDIKGNSFSGGTFKVQTSENGETYTDLKTYTTLGDIQNESFDALGENVRYIKWIYTEKSYGNVALGNIALAAYDNSPSISADDIAVEYNATSGNIMYTINNYVAGTMVATTEADWISEFTYNQVDEIGEVGFTTTANTGAERSAT